MAYYDRFYPNRTACDVLQEMRECVKALNFAPMLSLVEEMQIIANRMEAGLEDKRDIKEMLERKSKLKKEIRKLEKKKKKLGGKE